MSNIIATSGIVEGIPTNKTQGMQVGGAGTNGFGQYPHSKLHNFFKKHLQNLGVAQIIIGLQCFLFGIIESIFTLSPYFKNILFSFFVGFPFWATISFITSGSLTVISSKKHTKFLIGINIGANIISTVLAFIGLILLSMNLIDILSFDCSKYYDCLKVKNSTSIIVVLQIMVTFVQLTISFSVSGLTYSMNGCDISWVTALSCLMRSDSEDPYQDLLTQPEAYEDLVLQNTDSVHCDP